VHLDINKLGGIARTGKAHLPPFRH
jgi:hypothetical protein